MNDLKFIVLVLFLSSTFVVNSQKKKFKIHTIAFYNLENLFDTINDPNKFDEYSPMMELKTGRRAVYEKKVRNMAKVIADIGKADTNNSPALIGVSEVENKTVLEDLVNDSSLINKNYGIVHYDSPDARGIDVALLYQKSIFTPISSSKHGLKIYDDKTRKRIYTRDQLLVSGTIDKEFIHVIVNHWPSRRGGEERSRPKRVAAAKLSKHLVDSLQVNDPYAKVFIMGDLNDNPTNASIKKALNAKKDRKDVEFKGIYNPMETFYKNGVGTNAYRDNWNLFDQILITKPLLEKDYSSFRFYKAGIFNKSYLLHKDGKYKGYPFRSFSSGSFTNGYSDHLPSYVYIIKEIKD